MSTGQSDTYPSRQEPASVEERPAQTRAEARARAAANGQGATTTATTARLPAGLTRPPAAGELAYESTITAPTEWVPYKYTTAEIQTHPIRRGLSIAAVVCGVLGMVSGVFVIWGAPLSLAAVVLALVGRFVERRAGALWIFGLVSGIVGLLMAALWFIVITQMLPAYYL
jgi:hypothetical protein